MIRTKCFRWSPCRYSADACLSCKGPKRRSCWKLVGRQFLRQRVGFFQAKTSWKLPSHRDKTWCFGLFLNPPLERIYPPLLAGFQRGCFFIHFIVIKSRDNKLLRSAGQNFDQTYSSSCFQKLFQPWGQQQWPPRNPMGSKTKCVSWKCVSQLHFQAGPVANPRPSK